MESHQRRHTWPYVVGIFAGVIAGAIVFVSLRIRHIENRTREWVVSELEQRFKSQVQLDNLQVSLASGLQVTGDGLAIRYHNRSDLPPMFRVQHFSFRLGLMGIWRAPRHISGIYVENMTISLAPRAENKKTPEP